MSKSIREPYVVIEGDFLSQSDAQTIRVAIENFAGDLMGDTLGDDAHGKAMTKAYMDSIERIRKSMYKNTEVTGWDE